ncbi:hypothetical protein MKW92_042723 [Papaver armeniacum]|nr:hypothetical protein MKW92_042723 [Papaver armeniacum]
MIFRLMKAYMRSSSLHKSVLGGNKRLGQKCLSRNSSGKGGAVRQGTPYPKGRKTPASGGKSNKSLKSIGSVS